MAPSQVALRRFLVCVLEIIIFHNKAFKIHDYSHCCYQLRQRKSDWPSGKQGATVWAIEGFPHRVCFALDFLSAYVMHHGVLRVVSLRVQHCILLPADIYAHVRVYKARDKWVVRSCSQMLNHGTCEGRLTQCIFFDREEKGSIIAVPVCWSSGARYVWWQEGIMYRFLRRASSASRLTAVVCTVYEDSLWRLSTVRYSNTTTQDRVSNVTHKYSDPYLNVL